MKTWSTVLAATLFCYAAAAAVPEGRPAEILAHESAAGWLLTDKNGMTLYTNARDPKGSSACNDRCAEIWPPIRAAEDAQPSGAWAPITRKDGSRQWALNGRPLYIYVRDKYPGATVGDGVNSVWQAAFLEVDTPPGIALAVNRGARILVDTAGMTIYARTKGACTGACLKSWTPVTAPWIATAAGDWSVVDTSAGLRQWAYKGRALYTYSGDAKRGETTGNGKDGVWELVTLNPAPPTPAWMTVQHSDMGDVFADAKGMTVYVFSGDREKVRRSTCNDECEKTFWRPVLAEPDTKPVGNWYVTANARGEHQWTYKGEFLFTFARDEHPGQILGDKFGSGHGKNKLSGGWWRPVRPDCMCSPASGS